MPSTPHVEKHFTATDTIRDVVIGMSDGLTVPFALAAGLSAAVSNTSLIVTAGLAEVAAGAIAMGLGGYLAARTDVEHYHSERGREAYEVEHLRDREVLEIEEIFQEYGLDGPMLAEVVSVITSDKKRWIDFMMRFELGLEEPKPRRALASALTIGGSYIIGGLIPLFPYMMISDIQPALHLSIATTSIALAVFGAIKGHFTTSPLWRSALQTLLVGGLAATAAFMLAHLFS